MNYLSLAIELDRDGKLVEAAWAYELAIQGGPLPLDASLDLVGIYLTCADAGYAASEELPMHFVDAAYSRAHEVLASCSERYANHPEVAAWRLFLRERVLGERWPLEVFERLAMEGSELALVALFVASDRQRFSTEVRSILTAASAADSARKRYLLSYS